METSRPAVVATSTASATTASATTRYSAAASSSPPLYGTTPAAAFQGNERMRRAVGKALPPVTLLTKRHKIYLTIFQGLIPAIVDGAVNFGIQTAVYDNDKPINLFPFPNTLAGDFVRGRACRNIAFQ